MNRLSLFDNSRDGVLGLREQIFANAYALYPKVVTALRASGKQLNEMFDIILVEDLHGGDRLGLGLPVKRAVLIYNGTDGCHLIGTGSSVDAGASAAAPLRALLDDMSRLAASRLQAGTLAKENQSDPLLAQPTAQEMK